MAADVISRFWKVVYSSATAGATTKLPARTAAAKRDVIMEVLLSR
jgi:hypothetical protein